MGEQNETTSEREGKGREESKWNECGDVGVWCVEMWNLMWYADVEIWCVEIGRVWRCGVGRCGMQRCEVVVWRWGYVEMWDVAYSVGCGGRI